MRTLIATASLLGLGSASSSLFATPGAAPAAYTYAAQTAPTAYVNAVPYAQLAPPVAYTEQAGSSMGSTATYAAAGALVGAIAALAVSGRDARPARQQSRASAPMMFFSGDPNKFDARASFKSAPKESLLKTGKSATKVKSKKAISTKKTGSSFIDVTGRSYQEVSTFVPQYDEVGVLPPLGRWDPLQIREQGPSATVALSRWRSSTAA